ncbi:MAG: TetR family transcriptional regulator, partial [Acidimicrobiales bacterium]
MGPPVAGPARNGSSTPARADDAVPDQATPDGRIPGQRGMVTRRRLLEATVELVSSTPWRSVRVIDIARRAGTSPATFYQYFENVEQAIGVLAGDIVDEAAELAELFAGDWSEDGGWETALTVVEGVLDYWEENRAVFRVIELATEEGNVHLQGIRVRALNAVTVGLAQAVARHSPAPGAPSGTVTSSPAGSDPMAVAATLVTMVASIAAHRYGFEFWGIRTRDLVDAQARILLWSVTGRRGPDGMVGREARAARRAPGPRTGPVPGGAVVAHRV